MLDIGRIICYILCVRRNGMEHFLNYLVVLMHKAHFPFFAGFYIISKGKKNDPYFDIGEIGDNVPHVFLR